MGARIGISMARWALVCVLLSPTFSTAEDFAAIYPATLDYVEGAVGVDWTCDENDVWKLSSFSYGYGSQLLVECAGATVVFGKHGTNVVWAVVFPDDRGAIKQGSAGVGDFFGSVYLRFNPALVGELFPSDRVAGNGDVARVLWAERVYRHKIRASWHSGMRPMIPWKHSVVVDVQTLGGTRRFFGVDTEKGAVKYEPYFESQALPPVHSITPWASEKAFTDVWAAFDQRYAMFVIKPWVDWAALREEYLPKARAATTSYETAAAIAELLTALRDLHVYVRVGEEYLPGYTRDRPGNGNWQAVADAIPNFEDSKKGVAWGSKDGIGYINVYRLPGREMAEIFDRALEDLRDTDGLILDLRFNGGGDELVARDLAGRFADQAYVYSKDRYREGPKHDDLGPILERTFEPRGPWRYEKPVVALMGQRTMSSAESFALMLAQCPNVTTMGDRTAGSSANPRLLKTEAGIEVNMPRWLDLLPDETPLDPDGIAPDVGVIFEVGKEGDSVFAAALARLAELR